MKKKLEMQTPDLTDEKVKKILEVLPQVKTEIKDENGNAKVAIDFDLLKQTLSENLVEGPEERYRLDWPGKTASILKANTPIDKTLRPVKEDSVDFDTTENVFIEGDNFEVLKVLQESYLGKVKMIYIDPPYNTGKDFVYKDNFKQSKDEYEEELGIEDEDGGKLFKNTDTNGRFHSDWLSMMYERLVVARDLLKDDGVIFMSIDDNEVHNLRKIADEIFGEENFLAQAVWKKKAGGDAGSNSFYTEFEYILIYSKQIDLLDKLYQPLTKEQIALYKNPDNDPRGLWKAVDYSAPTTNNNPNQLYTITSPSGREFTKHWSNTREKFEILLKEKLIWFGQDGNNPPRRKTFLKDKKGLTPRSLMDKICLNQDGAKEFNNLFKDNIFDFPKPTKLIKHLLTIGLNSNDIVLDFFAGSGSTADAVMQLNAEDGGNRKFVMVQLPELIDEKSNKTAYDFVKNEFGKEKPTIAEISKERIRRAGKKILEENAEKLKEREKPLDIGFRVYKTASSNMKDVYYNPADLKQDDLFGLVDNIKEDRTPEDLLTQVILDLGLTLDLPIEEKEINGSKVFFVAGNSLVACFDKDIKKETFEEIAKEKPLKVVFRDSGFKKTEEKINLETLFKQISPETQINVL